MTVSEDSIVRTSQIATGVLTPSPPNSESFVQVQGAVLPAHCLHAQIAAWLPHIPSLSKGFQIAGIILVRKTPLAMRFMENWLRACEDERIITETPSAPWEHDELRCSVVFDGFHGDPKLWPEQGSCFVSAAHGSSFLLSGFGCFKVSEKFRF